MRAVVGSLLFHYLEGFEMLSTYAEFCWWSEQYGFGGPVLTEEEHARAAEFLTSEDEWMAVISEYLRLSAK